MGGLRKRPYPCKERNMDIKTTKARGRTFTKANAKTLAEFMSIADRNGCMKASDWTTGHGGYTSRRASPGGKDGKP